MIPNPSHARWAWGLPVRGTLIASAVTLVLLPVSEAAILQVRGQRTSVPTSTPTAPGGGRTSQLSAGGSGATAGAATGAAGASSKTGTAGTFEIPSLPLPLSSVEVPLPPDLSYYIKDEEAAIRLGKALFWDIQAGSDGMTACASCHNFGGTDRRVKNSTNPGFDQLFYDMRGGGKGPNATPTAEDFPFHLKADPNRQLSSVERDCDDVLGSAGVPKRDFVGVTPGVAADQGNVVPDPLFNVGGLNVDQVTGRNAPTVINAVFNVRQFWDGRADFNFNGVNIWGDRDPNAKVLRRKSDGTVVEEHISIKKASLASQAVGPAMSEVEMSWHGRDFLQLGRKLLDSEPLKLQMIDPTDMHLGSLSASPSRGMTSGITYRDMIQDAFRARWRAGEGDFDGYTMMERNFSLYWGLAIMLYEAQLVSDQSPFDDFVAGNQDALTEEEQRGMNRWFSGGTACATCHFGSEFAGGTWSQLNFDQGGAGVERMGLFNSGQNGQVGFSTLPSAQGTFSLNGVTYQSLDFDPRGQTLELIRPDTGEVLAFGVIPGAGTCNAGEEFTAVLQPGPGFPTGPVDPHEPDEPATVDLIVESTGEFLPGTSTCVVHITLDVEIKFGAETPAGDYQVLFDGVQQGTLTLGDSIPDGVYDVGYYNIGIRPKAEDIGLGADGPFGPLSITKRLQQGDPTVSQFNLPGGVDPSEYAGVHGAYRASSVRNISLYGPFMHNGAMSNLEQVIQFYARGADFVDSNVPDLSADVMGIGSLRNSPDEQKALVAFMANGLLDQRVTRRSGVFSHPSLPLKEGAVGDQYSVNGENGEATPEIYELPATGIDGASPSPEFVTLLEGGILSTLSADELTLESQTEELQELDEDGVIGCGALGISTDSQRTVRVFLGKQPSSDVVVSFSVSENLEVQVGGSSLTFTTENWFHPQEIRVKALGNDVEDDDDVASITFAASVSDDPEFAGHIIPSRTFVIHDTTSETGLVFVDVNATNSYEDGTSAFPFHSINEALQCGENLELVIAGGDYYEDIFVQGSSLILRSNEGAVIHGSGNAPVVTVLGHEASGTELHGIELTGGHGMAGGLFISDSAHALVSDCVIRGNSGELAGGIACRNSSSVELVNSVVQGNTSTNGAGGIQLEGGHADINSSFIGENSGHHGGAILARNSAPLNINESDLVDNSATRGGALALEGGGLVMNLSRVVGNTAAEQGGGIFAMNSASVELYGTKVTNNSALNGGGIYIDGGLLDAVRSTIATNGEALYLMNSVQLALNSTIVWADGTSSAIGRNDTNNALEADVEYSIVDFDGFAEATASGQDPMFVNADGRDHSVQSGSSAIDAGDPSLDDDPDGSRADIGAHTLLGE